MNNIVFQSTTQFLKFINEKIAEKQNILYKKPTYQYVYAENKNITEKNLKKEVNYV